LCLGLVFANLQTRGLFRKFPPLGFFHALVLGLDDVQRIAAQLSSVYVQHQLGEFMMNTVAVDNDSRSFEDFVAIADLAAGMIAEVVAITPTQPSLDMQCRQKEMSDKSDVIADWFWYTSSTLRKTCIIIDQVEDGRFGVGELKMASPTDHPTQRCT
jgi:hypothetical protein